MSIRTNLVSQSPPPVESIQVIEGTGTAIISLILDRQDNSVEIQLGGINKERGQTWLWLDAPADWPFRDRALIDDLIEALEECKKALQ